jgi:hypothetical protein
VVLASAGWLVSALVAYLVLAGSARTRLGALVLGGSGPIAALATLRLLERTGGPSAPAAWTFLAVPLAGCTVALVVALTFSRLRLTGRAASTWFRV